MAKLFFPIKATDNKYDQTPLENLTIERRFGKTEFFVVVDSKTSEHQIVQNTNKHRGGTKHTPDIVKENGAEIVIAAHMGTGAYEGIKAHGISILRGDLHVPIPKIIDQYNNGQLQEFREPEEHHSHH